MLRALRLFLPWSVFVLAGVGCQSPAPVQPRETQAIALDADTRQASVTAAVGNAIQLTLPAARQAGSRWQIVQNDTRYLQPVGALQPATETGGATVTFRAMRLGRTQLKFLAAPLNSRKGGGTAEYYDVVVVIE